MRIYVCLDHDGHWPVGVASLVFANDEDQARQLLDEQLRVAHLKPYADEPYTLVEMELFPARAMVLLDGEY